MKFSLILIILQKLSIMLRIFWNVAVTGIRTVAGAIKLTLVMREGYLIYSGRLSWKSIWSLKSSEIMFCADLVKRTKSLFYPTRWDRPSLGSLFETFLSIISAQLMTLISNQHQVSNWLMTIGKLKIGSKWTGTKNDLMVARLFKKFLMVSISVS